MLSNKVNIPSDPKPEFNAMEFIREVRRVSQPLIPFLVHKILPVGRVVGQEYEALNPLRQDKNYGSFKINLLSGKWADFATNDKGGDIISLYAYVNRAKQLEAAREIYVILRGGDHGK